MSTQPERPNHNSDDLNDSLEALSRDFDALGSVIEDEVKKAVGSLAGVAHSTVNAVADSMRDGFAGVAPAFQQLTAQAMEQARATKFQIKEAEKKAKQRTKRSPEAIAKRANAQAGSAGGFGLVAGIMAATSLAQLSNVSSDGWAGILVTGVIAAWFMWQSLSSWRKAKRLRRLSGYMRVLGDRTYTTVEQIALSLDQGEAAVRSDLRASLSHGMLEGAMLSPDGTRLFVGDTAYKLYLNQCAEQERRRAQAAATPPQPQKAAPLVPEGVLAECDAFVAALEQRNARIEDKQVSHQIEALTQHTRRIRTWLAAHPHQENRVRRFTSYYLPTILKLLDTYCDLQLHAVPGSVAQQSQKDIADILQTIGTAFQVLENSLVQDTAMDISAEISALQTVMAQEGLTQDDDFAQTSPQL